MCGPFCPVGLVVMARRPVSRVAFLPSPVKTCRLRLEEALVLGIELVGIHGRWRIKVRVVGFSRRLMLLSVGVSDSIFIHHWSRGVVLAQTIIESSNGMMFVVLDVDGIRMELYEPRIPDLSLCTMPVEEAKTTIVCKCTWGRAS